MATSPSDSFCVLPWTHVFADEEGRLFPCCFSHDSAIRDASGRPFQFSVPGEVEAAWNSEFMKTIRRQMLAGERPAACSTCWKTEDLGGRSARMEQNRINQMREPDLAAKLAASTSDDGGAPMDIRYIDIRLGNRCNLRCRMCSPHSSRLLIDEFCEIERHDKKADWIQNYLNFDWYKEQAAWEKLEPHLTNLNRLHFAGGEPLIIKEGFEFLRRIIKTGNAKNISITYNSNITKIPDEALELWPHFKSVEVCASLDGVGGVNEYIRHPSKWAEIEKNLMFLDREAFKYGVTSVNIHATIQIYNILNITELFRYAFENFRFISPYLFMDLVMGKPFLDIQILPESYRKLASERIDAFVTWLRWSGHARSPEMLDSFLARVTSIQNYLLAGERPELASEFRRATAIFDRSRKQELADYIPELAPFYRPVNVAGAKTVLAHEQETSPISSGA